MSDTNTRQDLTLVPLVGIGVSGEDLEPIIKLLARLPDEPILAVVLIPHAGGAGRGLLSERLRPHVSMPVCEVVDGTTVLPNHVYVVPPGAGVSVAGGGLALHPGGGPNGNGPKMVLDRFFQSLAAQRKSTAVGVLLSGSVDDGLRGLEAIRAEGGVTFSQDPELGDAVDCVLEPESIAVELTRLARHPYLAQPSAEEPPAGVANIDSVLARVRRATGIDFSLYKQSTVRRRLARRMMLRRAQTIEAYLRCLDEHPAEARLLGDDILVHVTSFFRDPGAYEVLRTEVFPALVEGREPHRPIRIWVPGCASGEEVYSIAIALLEYLGNAYAATPIQIFGSDLSEPAIVRARAGVYPEASLRELGGQRVERFFVKAEGGYRISKIVRELCVFVKHDVTRDPPFSRLDLISCRNLLIYFGPALQRRVLPLFHHSLAQPGFLMLGQAETVGEFDELFSLKNKAHKIYARKPAGSRLDLGLARQAMRARESGAAAAPVRVQDVDLQRELDRFLVERYAPAAVLVNEALEVVLVSGRVGAFLELRSGPFERKLLKLARESLVSDLRLVLHHARKDDAPARRTVNEGGTDGGTAAIELAAMPLRTPGEERYLAVVFAQSFTSSAAASAPPSQAWSATPQGSPLEARLREELAANHEYVRSITEEHEHSIAELASANEELMSANEELQSTNEELDTTKEELESANEELTTLNEDLHGRNEELSQAHSDIVNIFGAVDIPIVFVGRDRRIRRYFSPRARDALNLLPGDVGRAIGEIRPNFDAPDLDEWIGEAIETGAAREREVCDRDGRWHRLQVRPYRTTEGALEGAVLALVDVDALRRSLDAVRAGEAERERRAEIRTFLAEASSTLSSSLDYETTLASVTSLAVPRLGDWCAVDVFNSGEPVRVAVAHRDPTKVDLARELREKYPPRPTDRHGVYEVMRTRQSELIAEIPDEILTAAARNPSHLAILRQLGLRSALVVPMIAHERVLGTITLVYAESGRRYGPLELEVAEDLAYRAATAIDHALTFQDRAELAAIVDSAEDAILRTSVDGIISSWNAAAERMFGYHREEAVGRHVSLIVPDERAGEEVEILERLRRGERVTHRDTERVGKDGRRIQVSIAVSPITGSAGDILGAAIILRDIGERKEAESERTRLLAKLEQAVEARDTFLSIASHELRTPLNTLKLQTQHIQMLRAMGAVSELTTEKLEPRLEAVSRQADRLALLIEQLLDVSRITAGRLALEREEVDLVQLGREIADRFHEEARRARCAIELRAVAPVVGRWDRGRIDQVLTNLVSNALKYGAGKPVEITVERRGAVARLAVEDHGIGIAPKDQGRLFKRFERIVSARHFGGFGLGLWIVGQIVSGHGGTIRVESEVAAGARFTVELPLGEEAGTLGEEAGTLGEEGSTSGEEAGT